MTTGPGVTDSRSMMQRAVTFLLMAAALGCGSDVDLDLDVERGTDSLPGSAPPVGEAAWSRTDFDDRGGLVHDLAWTTDGGLVASIPMSQYAESGDWEAIPALVRHDADGAVLWEVEREDDAFLGMLAATPGGGVVVATMPEWVIEGGMNEPAGLDWYDADGNVTASWRLDATDAHDKLREVHAVAPLPDGGVVWMGRTLSDPGYEVWTAWVGRLDDQGQLLWMVPAPRPRDDDDGQPADLALTPDGGVLLVGSYIPEVPDDYNWSSYVARLELDGTFSWLTPLGGSGSSQVISVAPSGNAVLTGNFAAWMTLGDFRLEDEQPYVHHQFVAEIDLGGRPLSLSRLEMPSVASDEVDIMLNASTTDRGQPLVGGMYYTRSSASPQVNGYYAAAHSLDGSMRAETLFPSSDVELYGFGPVTAAASPQGRLAIGGSFSGRVDFGDGEVEGGTPRPDGQRTMKPFIAVFDPLPPPDVD